MQLAQGEGLVTGKRSIRGCNNEVDQGREECCQGRTDSPKVPFGKLEGRIGRRQPARKGSSGDGLVSSQLRKKCLMPSVRLIWSCPMG